MKSRLGELVRFYHSQKREWRTMLGKGVWGKELQAIMDAPAIQLPPSNPGIYNPDGTPQTPPPRDLEFENWLLTLRQFRK